MTHAGFQSSKKLPFWIKILVLAMSGAYYLSLPIAFTVGYPFGCWLVWRMLQGSDDLPSSKRWRMIVTWPIFYLHLGAGMFVQLECWPLAPIALLLVKNTDEDDDGRWFVRWSGWTDF